ncbi:MAG: sodium-dependent transporter [Legionellales bacterium]|nr:sodium-dependent transporter [Legionellales bacterium]OUX66487.1 MAG: hypothetical protein CBE41_00245 [Gammaproteobacteria bacterium TMED281]
MVFNDRWTSSFYFILAATGAAVGLGSIWKFPYEVGIHGGGLFVICYLFFIFIIGIPSLMAEILTGVIGRSDPVNVFHELHKKFKTSIYWKALGYLSLITLLMIFSFYSVVAGWTLDYLIWATFGDLHHASNSQIVLHWEQLQQSIPTMLLDHSVFSLLTGLVVIFPLKKGLERASKILMPLLFLIVIALVCITLFLPGRNEAIHYLFHVDWNMFSVSMIIVALGNACFTLAIGAGCMLVYGAYLPKDTQLMPVASCVAILNAFVALMSGFAIFSVVYTYHLNPSSGPGLMFVTLPICFHQVNHGYFMAMGFFILLFIAAWTSAISLVEPLVTYIGERLAIQRPLAAIIAIFSGWFIGLGTLLSFNVGKNWTFLGFQNFFECINFLTTDVFLNIGILGYTVFVGWCLSRSVLYDMMKMPETVFNIWYGIIRYLLPLLYIGLLFGVMV